VECGKRDVASLTRIWHFWKTEESLSLGAAVPYTRVHSKSYMKTAGCRISCSLERFGGVDKRRPNVFTPKNSLPPTGLEIMIILDLCTHRQDTHGILLDQMKRGLRYVLSRQLDEWMNWESVHSAWAASQPRRLPPQPGLPGDWHGSHNESRLQLTGP
jgi:hypothetical protein